MTAEGRAQRRASLQRRREREEADPVLRDFREKVAIRRRELALMDEMPHLFRNPQESA